MVPVISEDMERRNEDGEGAGLECLEYTRGGCLELFNEPEVEARSEVEVVIEVSPEIARAHEIDDVELVSADHEVVAEGTGDSAAVMRASILREEDGYECLPGQRVRGKEIDHILQIAIMMTNAHMRRRLPVR